MRLFARPPSRLRPGPLLWLPLLLVAAALTFGNTARAQGGGAGSYYEANGPYCHGTGGECFGDPVDVGTGAFHHHEELFSIPGRVPLSLG